MRDLARDERLPGGLYLIGARPGVDRLPFAELVDSVHHLVARVPGAAP